MQYQDYILRIYLGPTPFQPLSLLTTVNWGATRRSPLKLGYRTNVWTVEILAQHLNQRYRCSISPWTLRRRMKQMDLACKRPRYFYSEKYPHRAQKRGHCSEIEAPAAGRGLAL